MFLVCKFRPLSVDTEYRIYCTYTASLFSGGSVLPSFFSQIRPHYS